MNRRDVYREVSDRIAASLEKGVAPWKRPWKLTGGYPISLRSGKPYRGINVLLLMLEGRGDPRWGTFKACKEAAVAAARAQGRVIEERLDNKGGSYFVENGELFRGGVRKGEKATEVVLWKRVKRKDVKEGEDATYAFMRTYAVFNVTQCDEIPALPIEEERAFTPIETAEAIVRGYAFGVESASGILEQFRSDGPLVRLGGDRAAYSLSKDRIVMPEPGQFSDDESYYCTLFHELVHSTGSESRLKRIEPALFGTDPYAREELVAEIGSSFLSGMAGFDEGCHDQSASYIGGWLERISDDRKFVVQAAGQAQKAADLILGTTFENEDEAAQEPEKVAA